MIRKFILVLFLAGCSGGNATTSVEKNVEEQVSMAATPFTADQIREGCPTGRSDTYRLETMGEEPILRHTTFTNSTAESAEFRTIVKTEDGVSIGEPQTTSATWEELRKHAEYPAKATKIIEEEIVTPAGSFASKHYIVAGTTEDGTAQETHAWFAAELPGPPVLFQTRVEGTVVFSMELILHEKPQ